MKTTIEVSGRLIFDPKDVTKKHHRQAKWKKVAIVDIQGDWCNYYGWFFAKKGLTLNPPLRGAHVTFINDSFKKITGETDYIKSLLWNKTKSLFQKKNVTFKIELSPKTDGKHWWFRVTPDSRGELQAIRDILGMGQPNWGFHMTIGYANERNITQSEYLKTLSFNGMI